MKKQSRQEKTNALKTLESAIFEIMLFEEISKHNFQALMEMLPEYVKVLMGAESVEVLYDDIGKHNGICIEDKVVLNERFLKMPETEMAKIEQIFSVLKTSAHEVMHALDKKENAFSQSQRAFIEHKANGIKTFAKFCPQKKASYELLAEALYAVDRSEVFARQGAIKICKGFLDELLNYSAQNVDVTLQKKKDYDAFCKFQTMVNGQTTDVPMPKIAPESFGYILAKIKLAKAKDIVYIQEAHETNTMLSAFALKEKYLKSFKEDLKTFTNSALKCKPKALDETALIDLALTQEIEGVFDAETVQNLLTLSKKCGFKYGENLCQALQKTESQKAIKQDSMNIKENC